MLLHILWLCIIGLIAGALAKWIMPGPDPGGIIVTMLLGMAGSVLMGFLGRATGWYAASSGPGLIAATVGALIILFIYKKFIAPSVAGGGKA
jgi:uncharacterized membrane protein YeaQ/YmgE (transglycosylase-associated protein family)